MEIKQIDNLSNEIYHNGDQYKDYWSSSNLKEYLKTPREAIYQKTKAPKKQSDAFTFGNQLHDWLASKHFKGQPFEWNIFEHPVNMKTGSVFSTKISGPLIWFIVLYSLIFIPPLHPSHFLLPLKVLLLQFP